MDRLSFLLGALVMRIARRLFTISAISIMIAPTVALAQTASTDLPSALTGTIVQPCVEISYAADSSSRKLENRQVGGSPVKTFVYPDGHQKFSIEEGMFKGALGLTAEFPRSYPAGTEFKIVTVKPEKGDVELILAPTANSANVGDVKVMLGNGYANKTTPEITAQINQLLKVGSCAAAPKKPTTPGPLVTLDCTPNQAMVNDQLEEVVFDESSATATFQTVGKPKLMQPARFSDAQIEWNNGSPGTNREFYSLSRSSGILAIKNTDTSMRAVTGNTRLDQTATMLFTCSVRAKKF